MRGKQGYDLVTTMKRFQTRLDSFRLALVMAAGLLPGPPAARAADNVMISEFMAVNDGTVQDEDGDTPDWLEIFNAGTNTVNLNGWYLTDSAGNTPSGGFRTRTCR